MGISNQFQLHSNFYLLDFCWIFYLLHLIYFHIAASEDYNSTSYTLVFTPDNERDQQCRAVNILSDDNSEGTETFMATLSTRDDRVFLVPDTETIFIVDEWIERAFLYLFISDNIIVDGGREGGGGDATIIFMIH